MAIVSYLVTAKSVSPYVEMLRVLDGAPSKMTTFPFTQSPIAMKEVAWSPDGMLLFGARSGSASPPASGIRIWERDPDDPDSFTEWNVSGFTANFATSTAVQEAAWLDNNYLVLASNRGPLLVVIDRVNKTLELKQLNNTLSVLYVEAINETEAIVGSTNTLLRVSRSGNDATVSAVSGAPGLSSGLKVRRRPGVNKLVIIQQNSNIYYGDYDPATGVFSNSQTINIGAVPPSGAAMLWDRDGVHLFITVGTGDRIAILRHVGGSLVPAGFSGNLDTTLPSSPIQFQVNELGTRLAAALPNNSTPIRVYALSAASESGVRLAEFEGKIAATALLGFSWSDDFEIGAGPRLYDRALARLAPGAADLDNLKLLLLTEAGAAAFNPAHTTLTQARGANEATGSDWPVGGVTLTNITFPALSGGRAGFRFTMPPTALNAPGSVTFRALLVYEGSDASNGPLMMIDLGEDKTAVQYDQISLEMADGAVLIYTPAA